MLRSLRVEQLYPWPDAAMQQVKKRHKEAKAFIWAQEEPLNMGGLGPTFGTASSGRSMLDGRQPRVRRRALQWLTRPSRRISSAQRSG